MLGPNQLTTFGAEMVHWCKDFGAAVCVLVHAGAGAGGGLTLVQLVRLSRP